MNLARDHSLAKSPGSERSLGSFGSFRRLKAAGIRVLSVGPPARRQGDTKALELLDNVEGVALKGNISSLLAKKDRGG